jgi:hypothetical protein
MTLVVESGPLRDLVLAGVRVSIDLIFPKLDSDVKSTYCNTIRMLADIHVCIPHHCDTSEAHFVYIERITMEDERANVSGEPLLLLNLCTKKRRIGEGHI